MACSRLVLMVRCLLLLCSFSGWQAPNARHSGRCGQEGQLPEAYRNLDFLGDDVVLFYGPLYLDVTCTSCLPEEYMLLLFREMTPGMVSVFSTPLCSTVDSCSASVYEAFGRISPRRSCCMCRVGFTGCDAPSRYFPSGVAKPEMLCMLAGMDQKDCYDMVHIVQTANCGVSAVAVHRWSSTSLSRCRGAV